MPVLVNARLLLYSVSISLITVKTDFNISGPKVILQVITLSDFTMIVISTYNLMAVI